MNRGYKEDEVQSQIDRTIGLDRDGLLFSKRINAPLERVPLIVTYYPGLPPLRIILNTHSSILNVSERLRELAVRNPPFVVYRHPPNVKSLLVRATFKQKQHLS